MTIINFLQLSEDCRLRLYDVRLNFKQAKSVFLNSDVPTGFDIDDTGHLITTGHWDKQYLNSCVKLWDIRKLGDHEFLPLYTYEHK